MTEREPWPLLPALDELLAREGWQEDEIAVDQTEVRIYLETGISALGDRYLIPHLWLNADHTSVAAEMWPRPPFLRSRDAAALLEEALGILPYPQDTPGLPENCRIAFKYWHWWWLFDRDGDRSSEVISPDDEAAARTRAALEAGWRMGLWPVKP